MSLANYYRLAAIAAVIFLISCGQEGVVAENQQPSTAIAKPSATTTPKIPRFNRDSAYAYIAKQVNFGPRVVNTEAHDAARKWFVEKLNTFGAEVSEQAFTATAYTGEKLEGTNIIAQFEPDLTDRILLCAHWDSRHIADSKINTGDKSQPVDGADDGGSGVGVLLEIARQLGKVPPGIGVDIVLLDAEDYGESGADDPNSWGLGAQHYSRNLPTSIKPRYGILLDMVGAKNARFGVEEISEYYAPQVVSKVWKLAKQMGYSNYFVNDKTGAVTDDHYFINTIAGIPTIDIINRPAQTETETGFVEHWHTDHDNMEIIDRGTLRAVGQLVLAVVYREAAGTI
ncbi:MAG: M28 family peptidase [Bacteroidota bacterium]